MLSKKLLNFTEKEGILFPINFSDLKFNPKRIFYITNVPKNEIRGKHAHLKNCQYLICIQGKIKVYLHNGIKESSRLLTPGISVYVPNLVWDYQEYLTDNSILLSLCSEEYNSNDYIHIFDEFKSILRHNKRGKI